MHVVAKEPGGAPLEAARSTCEPFAVRFNLGDVVVGTDRHRAQWPRVCVGGSLVIHRDVEESGGAERLARRFDLFQMAAKRFLPLVDAEDRLECRRCGKVPRRVASQRVVEAISNRPLEGLMEDPALGCLKLAQLRFERGHVCGRPTIDDGRVEAA